MWIRRYEIPVNFKFEVRVLLSCPLVGSGSILLIRVLVVDPDKRVADRAATLLQARGYQTRAAYSAEAAMAEANDFHPHALISDVVLPTLDGAELAAWFAMNQSACKVILISFNPSASWRAEEAIQLGHAHAFISKSEDLHQLATILSAISPDPRS